MKKSIFFGAIALSLGVVLYSCEKEGISTNDATTQNDGTNARSIKASGTVVTEKRSYTWVGNKLDCSSAGSGCEVKAIIRTDNGDIDLSEIQVLRLIEIGKVDLNQYFLRNNLRSEFPGIYEGQFFGKVASGELTLDFQFPYLLFFDRQGNLERAFNYEATLSSDKVVAALRMMAAYDKKAELNTDTSKPVVWKCISAGDNCQTSKISFNLDWAARNPHYLFPSTNERIESVEVSRDANGNKLLLKTTSGKVYGVEL